MLGIFNRTGIRFTLLVSIAWLTGVTTASERSGLSTFYEAMGGTHWDRADAWLTDAPLDNWYGVEVAGGHVVGLRLADNNLTGQLPDVLAELESLDYLDLRWNAITGTIPARVGQMGKLKTLLLAGNNLTGIVPRQLGSLSNLERLDLSYNSLNGEIPVAFAGLKSLQSIGLQHNRLSGSIPYGMGEIGALKRVIVNNNDLYGPVPSGFGEIEGLHLIAWNNYIDQPADDFGKGNVVVVNPKSTETLYGVDVLDQTTVVVDDDHVNTFIAEVMRTIEVRNGFLHLHKKILPRSVEVQPVQELIDSMNEQLIKEGETIDSINDLERVFELYSPVTIEVPDSTPSGGLISLAPPVWTNLQEAPNNVVTRNLPMSYEPIHYVNCNDRTNVHHAHLSSDGVQIKGKVSGNCYRVFGTTFFDVYLYVVMAREKKIWFIRYFKHIERSRPHLRSNPNLIWSPSTAFVQTPCLKDDTYRTEAEFYAWSPIVGWYLPGPWFPWTINGSPRRIDC